MMGLIIQIQTQMLAVLIVASSCGDGVIDTDEGCDDGANNSDTDANACRIDCLVSSCGDGVVDTGEGCDNGDSNSDSGRCLLYNMYFSF